MRQTERRADLGLDGPRIQVPPRWVDVDGQTMLDISRGIPPASLPGWQAIYILGCTTSGLHDPAAHTRESKGQTIIGHIPGAEPPSDDPPLPRARPGHPATPGSRNIPAPRAAVRPVGRQAAQRPRHGTWITSASAPNEGTREPHERRPRGSTTSSIKGDRHDGECAHRSPLTSSEVSGLARPRWTSAPKATTMDLRTSPPPCHHPPRR
ncbi:hypothetical protein CBI38_31430 (plasmid) [Rhodococcus oxybenzonivorans]|uniref:Uncharacterized protein n=1 Tax=Rhodococcus oxybenzonivorans TaxID=1990687 RepID=A0A2S2C5K7_9NOCA|nr:hypothetical protein CBI38_31430 [Rhodococcus oxybenzonivorans]